MMVKETKVMFKKIGKENNYVVLEENIRQHFMNRLRHNFLNMIQKVNKIK